MASLRDHVELQERPWSLDLQTGGQGQQQQPPQRPRGLHVPRRVMVLASVAVVAVVATAAVVATVASSGESHTASPAAPVGHPAPQKSPRPNSPLDLSPMSQGFDLFHQVVYRARQIELEREMKAKKQADQSTKDSHHDFHEEAPNPKEHQEEQQKEEEGVKNTNKIVTTAIETDDQSLKVEKETTVKFSKQLGKHVKEEDTSTEDKEIIAKKSEVIVEEKQAVGNEKVVIAKNNDISKENKEISKESKEISKESEEISKESEENSKESEEIGMKKEEIGKKDEVVGKKMSTRLPSKKHSSGNLICETPECSMAAAQIAESLDVTADPCDDFYQFACGGWINKNPIPESGATGTFYEAIDVMDKRLNLILESPADPGAPLPLHMLRTAYDSCMDTDALDSLGLTPLQAILTLSQGGWPMVEDSWEPSTFILTTALKNLRHMNVYPLLIVGVDLDFQNVSTNVLYVENGGVPLGVYLMENPSQPLLEAYTTFMITAAKLLRDHLGTSVTDEEIEKQAQDVIDFEITFSKLVSKANNETTELLWRTDVTGLQADTDAGTPDQFNWLAFLKELFTNTGVTITTDEPLISFKSPFFSEFSNLIANTDTRILANALGWWWAFELQEETTYAMRNASSDFMQAFGSSVPERSVHCQQQTNANLGFALSREYVDQFIADTVKPEVSELVEDVRESFSSLLDNNTWMMPGDLLVAREKLAAIDPFVAYPDWIMDDQQLTQGYEGLNLLNGDHVGNLDRIGAWFDINSLATLREVPQHSFIFPPTVVNAFYNPQQNTITILGGILQPPFYAHNSLMALNYGGIGMVIGHEMTHGFDNSGRLFDKDGNLVQWWSEETITAYNEQAVCFVDQYNGFIPPEISDAGLNISVNGARTLGENIADNGGIREAYRAYQIFVNRYGEEPRLPGLDEFSPDHLFYLGFANEWCEHKNTEALLTQIALDPHSPGRYRVLGPLSNDARFSQVWNCPAGSNMNRGEDSCLLW